MNSAVPHNKPVTAIGSKANSVNKSMDVGKPRASSDVRKRQILIGGSIAAIILAIVVTVFTFWHARGPVEPARLNDDGLKLAKFAATNEFDLLPFDRQRLYMKAIGDKKKELEEQYKAGKISMTELEDALSIAWLGKQFKRIDKYYTLGELDKKHYLDKLLDEEATDQPKEAGAVHRDKKKVEAIVARFPESEKTEFETFRKALKKREKDRDKEAKAQAKAAKNTERPATRPTTAP